MSESRAEVIRRVHAIQSQPDTSLHDGPRDRYVQIRCTEDEKLRLRQLANGHRMTVSDYLRALAFDDLFRREHARFEGPLTQRLRQKGKV